MARVLGGRYELGRSLGEGGFGAVFEGRQLDLDRRVAIKILHTELLVDPDSVARFEREARAAGGLGHPNIAQVFDFDPSADEPYLVLELLEGRTLAAALVAERVFTPARAVFVARQLLAALEAAHAAGIIHRDVKPSNVFLVHVAGHDDFVKLIDFGIAKLDGARGARITRTGEALGSLAFMAPEQIRGEAIDARVDLWAAGATLYRMLSGRQPFVRTTERQLADVILADEPTPLRSLVPDLDARLVEIVERALRKHPDERWPSAREMRTALEALALPAPELVPTAPHPVHARVPPPPPSLPPPSQGPTPWSPTPPTPPSTALKIGLSLLVVFAIAVVMIGFGFGVWSGATSLPSMEETAPMAVVEASAPEIDASTTREVEDTPADYTGPMTGAHASLMGYSIAYPLEPLLRALSRILPRIDECHARSRDERPYHVQSWFKLRYRKSVNMGPTVEPVKPDKVQLAPRFSECMKSALSSLYLDPVPTVDTEAVLTFLAPLVTTPKGRDELVVMTGAAPSITIAESYFTKDGTRGVILTSGLMSIRYCHLTTRWEAPFHPRGRYRVSVRANGAVASVTGETAPDRSKQHEDCMDWALRAVAWPKSAKGGDVVLDLDAPPETE